MLKYAALSALLLGQITVCHAVTSCVDGTTAETEWMSGFFQIQTTKGSETYIYNANRYRFGFNTTASNPVMIRNVTENYTTNDFNIAGIEINNALGHFFRLEDSSHWAMPPFHNRVIFLEMNAGITTRWDGVALPFIVTGSVMEPTITNCFDVGWAGVDETNGDLLGLIIPKKSMSVECDAWNGAPGINAALIIFNTNVYADSYGGSAPPDNRRQHLLIHEYSHLSGIGHLAKVESDKECNSILIEKMDFCPTNLQTQYTCQDISAIRFMLADDPLP